MKKTKSEEYLDEMSNSFSSYDSYEYDVSEFVNKQKENEKRRCCGINFIMQYCP